MLEGALRHVAWMSVATATAQLKRQSCSKEHCDI